MPPRALRSQVGGAGKGIEKVLLAHLGGLHGRDRRDVVVRSAKQDRPKAEEIPGDLEIDDLPRAIGKDLAGRGPARGQDIGGLVLLSLMDHVVADREAAAAAIEVGHRLHVIGGKPDEGREFSCKRAVLYLEGAVAFRHGDARPDRGRKPRRGRYHLMTGSPDTDPHHHAVQFSGAALRGSFWGSFWG